MGEESFFAKVNTNKFGWYVITVLAGIVITGIITSFISDRSDMRDAKDLAQKAVNENAIWHPRIDSICSHITHKEEIDNKLLQASKEDYDRRTYRDSVRMAEQMKTMSILIKDLRTKK